ncbi:MAG: sigma-70 family RNA polymerase sigma factor [Planctomycetota bacterium]|jgi:RNA polymerase sigma-70 factor (ECF subfamily)
MDERDLVEHASFLQNLARHLLSDEHLAQDAVQDACVAAIQTRPVRNVRSWLAAVTRNLSLRIRRRETGRKGPERAAARPEGLPSTLELAVQAETQRRVAQAVLELEEPYRSTILLRFLHHRTPSQIARHSGEPVATVKTRLRRALLQLRGRLDAEHGGDGRAWALALLPLAGRRSAPFMSLGGRAVFKTKMLAAGIALMVLATLFVTVSLRGGAQEEGRARAPHGGAAVKPTPAETAASIRPDAARAIPPETTSIEAVSAEERARYEEWRKMAQLIRFSRKVERDARALLAELRQEQETRLPVPDPASRVYVEELIRKYRSLGPGAKRLAVLGQLVQIHSEYLRVTHDTGFLPFLEEVILRSPVEAEREGAIPDGDIFGLIDLLLRLTGHSDPMVRAGAMRSLAHVEDASRGRALEALVRGLEDGASVVRWTTALQLEYAVADPAHAAVLLARLPRETHPLAMESMVRAIVSLQPDDGIHRVEAVVLDAPPAIRSLALGATSRPEPEKEPRPDFDELMARATAKRAEPKEDDAGRHYLTRLLEEYHALPAGPERLAVVEKLAKNHARYLEKTGDRSFLPVLRELALSSPSQDERLVVVRSFNGTSDSHVVDLLIELKTGPDPAVRGAVATCLAWVRGTEVKRAHVHLVQLLDDPAPSVRRVAALLVGVPLGDPARVPLLLAKLGQETELLTAYMMIDSILRLEPDRGRSRIESMLQTAPAATRTVVGAALQLHDERRAK